MDSVREWKTLALFVLCVAVIAAPAQTMNTFWLTPNTGGNPSNPLVQGVDGNLYGTAFYAGSGGDGTVFRMTPDGTLSLVHYFHGTTDGANPLGLVLGLNGNLYGTTEFGGANSCNTSGGCGTVFGFTSAGTLSTLHSFDGADGSAPLGMTLGSDGNFYGITLGGGSGYGTIFKITPQGTFTLLHAFDGTDGASPFGSLIQGVNGDFYGTTEMGGLNGFGTVFVITHGGTLTTIHNFNETDGSTPEGALVQVANGNLYGTTFAGGPSGAGTIFVISPGGRTFQTLYNFTGGVDGGNPNTGLVLGNDGNFYGGTSAGGGGSNTGELFEVTPSGVVTGLAALNGTESGGRFPTLMQATTGTFFGTTYEFGGYSCKPLGGCGTTFSLSTGLGAFVTAVPSSRGIGARVIILGQGLTGATSVTFNGVTAAFTVTSDTEITTSVPTGAKTGSVQVTTPTGTLSTKVAFVVN
jgi:uncharacterized repeat protein (TIGR03803 family)